MDGCPRDAIRKFASPKHAASLEAESNHANTYVGSEGTTGRALTFGYGGVANAQMTVAACTSGCKALGYTFAGVEYGGECCE